MHSKKLRTMYIFLIGVFIMHQVFVQQFLFVAVNVVGNIAVVPYRACVSAILRNAVSVAIHKIISATTMNMYINKTGRNIFSFCIYFNCILTSIFFSLTAVMISPVISTTFFNNFSRRYYFTVVYFYLFRMHTNRLFNRLASDAESLSR